MKNSSIEQKPLVSIIVPTFNESGKIHKFINSIEKQNYPEEKIELIVIDNGSTDGTYEQLKNYNIKLLKASEVQSPYYARNAGLKIAKGDIIALLDMNKKPAPNWIQKAIEYFSKTEADIVTGNIKFDYSSECTIYELMDSIMYFDNKHLVESSNACAAGNLLFKREVFEEIGTFPVLRSGMDMLWTKQATSKSFNLHYAEELQVTTKAKKKWGLYKKSIRVGTGHPYMWSKDNMNMIKILLIISKNFIPPLPNTLKKVIRRRNIDINDFSFGRLYLLFYSNQVLVGIGRIIGLKNIFNS